MSVKTHLKPLTAEEYIEGEQHSSVRHELVGGQAYAMVGASNIHNQIALTLASTLRTHLRGTPCRAYISDMKVRVGEDFYYPDLVVSCAAAAGTFHFVTDPVLIIEVLSPSTERQDRLEKRLAYARIPSLQEYVLISQEKLQVEIHRRIAEGWELERCGQDDTLQFDSIGLTLPLVDIYEDVMNLP